LEAARLENYTAGAKAPIEGLQPSVVLSKKMVISEQKELKEADKKEKKGTYRRRADGRRAKQSEDFQLGDFGDRKRQLPEEIDVDNLSPKKLRVGGSIDQVDVILGIDLETDKCYEKAGLLRQSRLAK
jgi:hypothetical protein